MFLIIGHDECPYCEKAKELIFRKKLSYNYIDVKHTYPQDWREVFRVLQSQTNNQRSVPIIFYSNNEEQSVPQDVVSITPQWQHIGGFPDLEKFLYVKLGVELDDDY